MVDRSVDDVDDRWVLSAAERALLGNKSGATRLGFAVLLKMFQAEGQFPPRPEDVPAAAVEAIARQINVTVDAWRHYGWSGRTFEYHRARRSRMPKPWISGLRRECSLLIDGVIV